MARYLRLNAGTVDLLSGTMTRYGRTLRLSTRELDLLTYLASRPGQVVSRAELLTKVWQYHPDSASRAVAKTLNRLRSKVEVNPRLPDHLMTLVGQGFRFVSLINEPELPPLDWTPTNLPSDIDRFVGRDVELQSIAHSLNLGRRWVTLVGPAGIGKSRLALAVARPLPRSGGVWFLDLNDVHDTTGLIRSLVRLLNAPDMAGFPDAQRHMGRLLKARGPMVLVLDNAESVAPRCGRVLSSWLQAAPELVVLATSRLRFSVGGEHVVEVQPLPLDQAALLFRDRFGDHAQRWTDGELYPVVQRLHGLPLAIELTAIQPIGAELNELASELDQLLDQPVRSQWQRDQTLRASLEASWRRLSTDLQVKLPPLTVFRGGFDAIAARLVLGLSSLSHTRRLLAALRDSSFLRAWLDPVLRQWRYDLTPIIRQFLVDKSPPDASFEDRHAEYFVAFAEATRRSIRRLGGASARLRLACDRPNLVAAVERSCDRRPHLAVRLALSLHMDRDDGFAIRPDPSLLEMALQQAQKTDDHALVTRVAVTLAGSLWDLGQRARASDALGLMTWGLDASSDVEGLRISAFLKGGAGDVESAFADLRQAHALAEGNSRLEAKANQALAGLLLKVGRWDQAIEALEAALAVLEQGDDRILLARTVNELGGAFIQRRDFVAASRLFARAGAIHLEVGHVVGDLQAQVNQATCEFELGQVEQAERRLRSAIEGHRKLGMTISVAVSVSNLGILCMNQRRWKEAEVLLREAAGLNRELERVSGELLAQLALGIVRWRSGERVTVERSWKRVAELTALVAHPNARASADLIRAAWLASAGRLQDASALVERARPIVERTRAGGGVLWATEGWMTLGRLRKTGAAGQRLREARELLRRAVEAEGADGLGGVELPVAEALREALHTYSLRLEPSGPE